MNTFERLTYLLGIMVAVIAWAVAQLNQTVTADEVISYKIVSQKKGSDIEQILTLENLSRSKSPSGISVSQTESPQNCITTFDYYFDQLGFSPSTDPPANQKRDGYGKVGIQHMSPGARINFLTRHPASCEVTPLIDIDADAGARPRLVQEGFETWVLREQFYIYLFLILAFGAAFITTYVLSYRMVRTASGSADKAAQLSDEEGHAE